MVSLLLLLKYRRQTHKKGSILGYLCDTFIDNKLTTILFKLVTSVRSTAVSETEGELEDFGDNREAFTSLNYNTRDI